MVDESKQLLIDSVNDTAAATATTVGQYKLLTGKGPVYAVSVMPGSDTIADLSTCFITVLYNNTQVIRNAPLSLFSRDTAGLVKKMFPTSMWVEGSIIDYTIVNGAGNAIPVSILFYYQAVDENDPVQVALFNEQQKQYAPPTVY